MLRQLKFRVFHIYHCFCAVGLIYQSVLIIQIYLQYKVNYSISIEFPMQIIPGAVSICTRFTDVLDFKKLNLATGRKWSYSKRDKWVRFYQHNLTVGEIFRFTPQVDNIVDRVVYKNASGFLTLNIPGREAYDHITVKKYVYTEFICFMISLKSRENFTFENLAITPVGSGLIYRIDFSESLKEAQYLKLSFSRFSHYYPIRSSMISPVIRRKFFDVNDKELWSYNLFTSSFYSLHATFLPAPHETRCFDYTKFGFHHDIHCAQNCTLIRTLKELGKNPYSVIILKPNDRTMISYQDMQSKHIVEKVLKIEKNCKHQCRFKPCIDNRIVTVTNSKQARRFQLSYVLPTHPSVDINAFPHLSFVEFLTYFISTISTWTGLSIISMNPITLMLFAFKKKNSPRYDCCPCAEKVNNQSILSRIRRLEELLLNKQRKFISY